MNEFTNEDIGQSVIRRVNKFYNVQSADADEMKVIIWVDFDHENADTLGLLNKFINDVDNSNGKKGPYEFEFGFGNPDIGGEIHTLKGLKDNDLFVLSAWFDDDTDAEYSQEEYTDYSDDIYNVISYYLHRLKAEKGANESVSNKDKMTLSEAKQELREHGYKLIKE